MRLHFVEPWDHDASRILGSSGADEWQHKESKQMQTNLAHLVALFHTPPGPRRRLNTLQTTPFHLLNASCAQPWSSQREQPKNRERFECQILKTG